MKYCIVAFFCLLFSFQSIAQPHIPRMKIEEVVKMIDTSTTPLVVNFWATWCKPCITEIPWFESAVAALNEHGVKLVLVSLDFSADYNNKALHRFVSKAGYVSQVIWLDETNADKFCPAIDKAWGGAIPATLMVNNSTGFREFYEFQLKEGRLHLELKKLIARPLD